MDERTQRLIELIKKSKELYSDKHIILAIPQFLSKKFVSYCSIREDLMLMKLYLEKLKGDNDGVITSALTYSLISLYGKCFTDASKNKAPKLEPTQIFKEKENLVGTHEYLMDLRHNFIAHRGETASEVGIAYLLIPKEEGETEIRFRQKKQHSLKEEKLLDILVLLNFLIEEVEKKIEKSGQKLPTAFFDNFNPEQAKYMLLNNATE